jgi:hypothetical protein
MKHTQGPWEAGKIFGNGAEAEIAIKTAFGDPGILICGVMMDDEESDNFVNQQEAIHNANLIAAAPDLLAALCYLRDCIESGNVPSMSSINAAIAKATK